MTKEKIRSLTEADLAWFDLGKYSSANLGGLGLRAWLQILDDRVALKRQLEVGAHEHVLKQLQILKGDPTTSLNTTTTSTLVPHGTDTPTVKAIRVSQLRTMVNVAERLELGGSACYDLSVPLGQGDGFDFRAHISVDFLATKAQIKKDFETWLKAMSPHRPDPTNRVYEDKIQQWISSRYLPYFDLHLFALANRASLPQTLVVAKLDLHGGRAADAVKTAERSLEVFTWQTAEALRLSLPPTSPPA